MMEKKHSEKQDDSYYDALIKQRIGEALRNQSKKERLDLAQLEAWVEADRQRRRAKVKRVLAIASCFIIICAGTFSFKFAFDDDAIATAGKNDNKVNEEGNNVVVKPNEDGAEENTGGQKLVIDKWDNIKLVKEEYSDLKTPEFIPDGYSFEKLVIEDNELIKKYTYTFSNNREQMELKQIYGSGTNIYYKSDRSFKYGGLELFIKDESSKSAYCNLGNDELLFIGANCSDSVMGKIAVNFK